VHGIWCTLTATKDLDESTVPKEFDARQRRIFIKYYHKWQSTYRFLDSINRDMQKIYETTEENKT